MPNEWQSVLDEIRNNVSDMAFQTYFSKLVFVSNKDGVLTVCAPNIFVKNQIDVKFKGIVIDAMQVAGLNATDLVVDISPAKDSVAKRGAAEVRPDEPERVIEAAKTIEYTPITDRPTTSRTPSVGNQVISYGNSKRFSTKETGLNPKYRLDNYIVGSNNDLAVSAAHNIIENPGTRYNPYFIYGGPGLGKTHLIQAIGNEILVKHPEMRVLYVTIEEFYHDFVEAMRKKIDGFAEKYRKVDVLIVDDFQFIVGKEKSQEEFFHTFNELHQHNKQIIVSSDRLPSQIASVDDRLASRLTMGMPIDIQLPDFETRCAILKAKAEELGSYIDDESVEYLAESVRTNIRELGGKLNQLLLVADMRGVSPREILKDQDLMPMDNAASHRKNILPRQVVERVAKYYEINPKDLLGTSRVKNIKSARQIAMYLMNKELGLSTVKIGSEFGKDHTTIMHGIKVIESNLSKDFSLREQITELREKIYAA